MKKYYNKNHTYNFTAPRWTDEPLTTVVNIAITSSTVRSKVAVSVSSFGYEQNTNSTSYISGGSKILKRRVPVCALAKNSEPRPFYA